MFRAPHRYSCCTRILHTIRVKYVASTELLRTYVPSYLECVITAMKFNGLFMHGGHKSSAGNRQDASHPKCLETLTSTKYTNFYF